MLDHPYKASILLLDGQTIELLFSANSTIYDILPSIPTSTKTDDARLIHYAVHDDFDHIHWLSDEKRLIDYVDISTKTIFIKQHIRYFVDSILYLQDPIVVELYFLEVLQQLNKNVLDLSIGDFVQISALLLQIYSGDFNREQHLFEQMESVVPCLDSILIQYHLSRDDYINQLTNEYSHLNGEKRGSAMIRLMKLVEKCVRYGCRFYHVREDSESAEQCVLAINTNGILVYSSIYSYEPKNFFHWKFMDNIYYRNDRFWIEVREARRSASVLGGDTKSFFDSQIQTTDDVELLKAVNDPTTQFSIPRRSLTTPCVNVHSFRCDSSMLCKTIWQTAIAQHRFYLEQSTNKSRASNGPILNHQDLNDRLNRLISKSSIGSSLPSLSSLHSTSSLPSMPSAKIADGSCSSLSSIRNGDNKTASGCSGNVLDEKKRELEHYNKLTKKRQFLDEKLREKMKELFNVCLMEAEYTGELSKEIKFALFPGQEQPKIRKRIGTSFSIPEQLIAVDKSDKLGQLETDVELHRRIVAAAEKLAMDKSTNKSVRKKRLRDYQAAAQKLRGLEVGLSQLRLSISKPDVSSKSVDDDDQAHWTGYSSSGELLTRAVAKSCPTTPRGSIPDLFNKAQDDNAKLRTSQDIAVNVSRRTPSKQKSLSSNERDSIASSSGSSITGFTSPPSSLMLLTSSSDPMCTSTSPKSNSTSSSLRGPPDLPTKKLCSSTSMTMPSYNTHDAQQHHSTSSSNFENVGYRSKSYRSSYRQAHYPTIQDEQYSRKRAVSAHALPSTQGTNPRVKMPAASSIRKSSPSDDDVTPTADNPPSSSIGSSATLQHSSQRRRPLPSSISCSAGFTSSLDRRSSLRASPNSDTTMKLHMNQNSSRSPSAQRVTTFPVSVPSNTSNAISPASCLGSSSTTSVPLPSSGLATSNISPSTAGQTVLPRFQPPLGRTPLAYFPPMTNSGLPTSATGPAHQKMRQLNQSLSSSRLPSNTDPHMEALLSYYKSNPVATHQPRPTAKTATTV